MQRNAIAIFEEAFEKLNKKEKLETVKGPKQTIESVVTKSAKQAVKTTESEKLDNDNKIIQLLREEISQLKGLADENKTLKINLNETKKDLQQHVTKVLGAPKRVPLEKLIKKEKLETVKGPKQTIEQAVKTTERKKLDDEIQLLRKEISQKEKINRSLNEEFAKKMEHAREQQKIECSKSVEELKSKMIEKWNVVLRTRLEGFEKLKYDLKVAEDKLQQVARSGKGTFLGFKLR